MAKARPTRRRPDRAPPGLRRRAALAACVAAAALAAAPLPSAAADAAASPTLFLNPAKREAQAPGVAPPSLRFVTVDGFAPFSAFDETGRVRGVHVDLAREICVVLGVTGPCTIQVAGFRDMEGILTSEQADAAMAGLVADAGMRRTLAFSEPYARLPARLITRTGGMAVAGMSAEAGLGVVDGSVHAEMAKALFPERRLEPHGDLAALLEALKAGRIAEAFADGVTLGQWAASPASAGCCALEPGGYFLPALKPDALRIAVAADRPELQASIDKALRTIERSGRLNDILLRHLPADLLR